MSTKPARRGASVLVHEEVADAQSDGRPVVALETAVMTAGLPRETLARVGLDVEGWPGDEPVNALACARMCAAVRGGGAIPAVIGVIDGRLLIGMSEAERARLAADEQAGKASAGSLAGILEAGGSAGTTVSATLVACGSTDPPIRVFATGGIGGVHRGWTARPDVSADLGELARRRCAVVCSGMKSLLDVAATLELLEAAGVAVVGHATDRMPEFIAAGRHPIPARLETPEAIAGLCCRRWNDLGQPGAVLVANPAPDDVLLATDASEAALGKALDSAAAAGITGPAMTPFVLAALAQATGGGSLRANLALLERNAALAASIARAFSDSGR